MADWELLPKDEATPRVAEPRVPVSRKKRFAAAFAVAILSDILSAWFEFVPPVQWTLDILTAGLLFLLLGRQWVILPALIAEAIPGLAVFPFWVLVVASIAVWGKINPLGKKSSRP
jgi:hypothetical protein